MAGAAKNVVRLIKCPNLQINITLFWQELIRQKVVHVVIVNAMAATLPGGSYKLFNKT
jgi:hypothetical protein